MKEFVISEAKAETCVLVGLITPEQDEAKTTEYLDELEFLADTAGAVTLKRFTQRVNGPSMVSYVGKGKLEEIAAYIKERQDAYDEWQDEHFYEGGYITNPDEDDDDDDDDLDALDLGPADDEPGSADPKEMMIFQ